MVNEICSGELTRYYQFDPLSVPYMPGPRIRAGENVYMLVYVKRLAFADHCLMVHIDRFGRLIPGFDTDYMRVD